MHNKTTRTLFILSVVGIFFYFPYMWIRCSDIVIKSKWRVQNSITNFWELIEAKLSPACEGSFVSPLAQGDLNELTRQTAEAVEAEDEVTSTTTDI